MLSKDWWEMLKMKKSVVVLLQECWSVAGQQLPERYCAEWGGFFAGGMDSIN